MAEDTYNASLLSQGVGQAVQGAIAQQQSAADSYLSNQRAGMQFAQQAPKVAADTAESYARTAQAAALAQKQQIDNAQRLHEIQSAASMKGPQDWVNLYRSEGKNDEADKIAQDQAVLHQTIAETMNSTAAAADKQMDALQKQTTLKANAYLSAQNLPKVPVIDPATGQPKIDPDTQQPVLQTDPAAYDKLVKQWSSNGVYLDPDPKAVQANAASAQLSSIGLASVAQDPMLGLLFPEGSDIHKKAMAVVQAKVGIEVQRETSLAIAKTENEEWFTTIHKDKETAEDKGNLQQLDAALGLLVQEPAFAPGAAGSLTAKTALGLAKAGFPGMTKIADAYGLLINRANSVLLDKLGSGDLGKLRVTNMISQIARDGKISPDMPPTVIRSVLAALQAANNYDQHKIEFARQYTTDPQTGMTNKSAVGWQSAWLGSQEHTQAVEQYATNAQAVVDYFAGKTTSVGGAPTAKPQAAEPPARKLTPDQRAKMEADIRLHQGKQ